MILNKVSILKARLTGFSVDSASGDHCASRVQVQTLVTTLEFDTTPLQGSSTMTFKSLHCSVRSLAAGVVVATLMLGLSGAASAHGNGSRHHGHGQHADRTTVVVVHDEHRTPRRAHRYKSRGHRRAHRRGHRRGNGHGRRYGRGHYPREVVYVYERRAPVREVVHVYEERTPVVVNRPLEHNSRRSFADGTLNAGSLVGAAIGGLIGSRVGGGSGKLVATAAGTLGGFLLGGHVTNHYR